MYDTGKTSEDVCRGCYDIYKTITYRETFADGWSTRGYLCQTGLYEAPELVWPLGAGQRRRVILGDVVEGAHSVHVEQRGLSLRYKQAVV